MLCSAAAPANALLQATPTANPNLVGQKLEKVLVTIDPGHGGKDPGAIGLEGLREVDVILPISLRIAKILEEQGVATQLTRDSDYFVGLDERVVMSRKAGADIFVSIHANSIDNRPDVNGLETYHYHRGLELATVVHRTIVEVFNDGHQDALPDRGVRSARFLVLRKSEIPAILVEVGYLTSPTESPKLADEKYRDRMAAAIAQGILEYLGKSTNVSLQSKITSPNLKPPVNVPAPVVPVTPPQAAQK
jgi:N-acetylmuramoyl-L-alanine amidase